MQNRIFRTLIALPAFLLTFVLMTSCSSNNYVKSNAQNGEVESLSYSQETDQSILREITGKKKKKKKAYLKAFDQQVKSLRTVYLKVNEDLKNFDKLASKSKNYTKILGAHSYTVQNYLYSSILVVSMTAAIDYLNKGIKVDLKEANKDSFMIYSDLLKKMKKQKKLPEAKPHFLHKKIFKAVKKELK